ncbi:MAG: endonuclease/exonuclease/phosphatase family protein [Bacteroidales bacterium]|nr:endonuclease/exonuclease/phosphatase family protein [Bacteroidales bacterium]
MRSILIIMASFAAGALILDSCHKDVPVQEAVSVIPGTVDAAKDMASYKLEVTANCTWSVTTEGDDGQAVYWITPDRSSGHDSAIVTIRVNENKYNDSRSASVVFTTPGGQRAVAIVTQKGDAGGSDAPGEATLCLGTYNLRMSNLDTDDVNKWSVRKERLKQSINDCGFDVFGIQEVSTEMQTWLESEFKGSYTFRFFSPYSQNGNGNKANGIGYRTSAFALSDWHFFWATGTPDTMSTNDTGSSGSFNRGGCCCILTHKQSGARFFFMNTHACLNNEPNAALAPVYIEQEKRFNPGGLPSFFVGDMNARPEYQASETYRSYWKDSYQTALRKSGASASYNGFTTVSGKYRIDYIYHRGNGITINDFCISNKLYDGKYASDHFPVIVNCKLSK